MISSSFLIERRGPSLSVFVTMDKLLTGLYYNLEEPASFSGIDSLYKAAKKLDPLINRKQVKDFLLKQHVYLRHRRIRKPRGSALSYGRFVTTGHGINWSCDTGVFRHSKIPYLLVCKDNFSGYTYAKSQEI